MDICLSSRQLIKVHLYCKRRLPQLRKKVNGWVIVAIAGLVVMQLMISIDHTLGGHEKFTRRKRPASWAKISQCQDQDDREEKEMVVEWPECVLFQKRLRSVITLN